MHTATSSATRGGISWIGALSSKMASLMALITFAATAAATYITKKYSNGNTAQDY